MLRALNDDAGRGYADHAARLVAGGATADSKPAEEALQPDGHDETLERRVQAALDRRHTPAQRHRRAS